MPSLNGGGAERTMINLAHGIAERGYKVDLVLSHVAGPYLHQVPKSLEIVDLRGGRVLNRNRTFMSLPALMRYLRYRRPDAMLSVLSRANLVALWARRLAGVTIPVVVSERNNFSLWGQDSREWNNRLTFHLAKRAYTSAHAVTAVSKGVADDLSQVTNLRRDQIQVIYNPVITPELRRKMRAPLDHPWFEPGQPPVVLAVGRLTTQKDFGTLIQAFAILRKMHAARLMILGEGEKRPELEGLIKELGLERDVRLPGWVDNPYPFMVRAGLFVLSSKWEGLPGVLIEALFAGVPVISTDCPCGPREILADGKYGRLVPIGNVMALATAMKEALFRKKVRFPKERMQLYELDAVVDRYLHTFFGNN